MHPRSPQTSPVLTANPPLCSRDDLYAAAKGYKKMMMMTLETEGQTVYQGRLRNRDEAQAE